MNTVVCAKTNQDIILLDQIANSGEGEVWTTNWSRMLAKIYHHPTSDRFAKLEVMISHQPDDPNKQLKHNSFAFPQSLIKDNKGNLIGFLMPQIIGGIELINLYSPRIRKSKKLEVDWHFLHSVAFNIASIMAAIHREGYIIGDIKPQNILVNSQALPSFIDTDSFQVRHPYRDQIYHCLVGTEGYTPPELIGKDFHNIEQYIYHDNFRLGVLIYQLLFSYHPFSLGNWQGAGDKPEQNDLIKQGIWIESDHNLLIHNHNTIPLNIVHPALQKLFKKCFNDGHSQPHLRPSAEDWFYALRQGVNNLQVCDQIDSHVYSSLENNCYWCARKSKLDTDIFELPTGIKSTSKTRVKSSSSTNSKNYQTNLLPQNKNKSTQIFDATKREEILKQNGKEITIIGQVINFTNGDLLNNQISRYLILEIKKLEFFDNNQEYQSYNLQEDHPFYIIVNFKKFPLFLDTINELSINLYLKIYGNIQINKGINTPEICLENPNQITVLSESEVKSLLSFSDINNNANVNSQSQQKSSNPPLSSVKVSKPKQKSSPAQTTHSYTYVKPNLAPFQAQPAPKKTRITITKQSSPTQNKNFQNSQRNSTSNSNDLLESLAFFIILIPTILTLFIIIEWGNLGWVIMTFLITSFVCISIFSYLNRDLDGFKRSLFLVLLVYFTIVITWFYGIGWGIIGFIVYFSFFRILFS
ncbi:protein kinase domain-containing protein [Geminocystis sp. CENA526]|uniref:protein kinase domain-containing protein n=1 Tax=Geminocystis sp. CENA526 TaxID=1355871 RepID=UPI003D6DF6F4